MAKGAMRIPGITSALGLVPCPHVRPVGNQVFDQFAMRIGAVGRRLRVGFFIPPRVAALNWRTRAIYVRGFTAMLMVGDPRYR